LKVFPTTTTLVIRASDPFTNFDGAASLRPSGIASILFTFTVTYTDVDNDAPQYVRVVVDGILHAMSKQNSGDANYTCSKRTPRGSGCSTWKPAACRVNRAGAGTSLSRPERAGLEVQRAVATAGERDAGRR
jgi:hypothetical protein